MSKKKRDEYLRDVEQHRKDYEERHGGKPYDPARLPPRMPLGCLILAISAFLVFLYGCHRIFSHFWP